MNTKIINQIKELPWVKEVTEVNGMAVVVFEPRIPVLHDEYGVQLYDGDTYWWVDCTSNDMEVITPSHKIKNGSKFASWAKIFSTPESAQKWIDENKKPKPVYVDPEDGTEFFDGDEFFWFHKETYSISSKNIDCVFEYGDGCMASKIFKTRKDCAIALAKFITDKYANR